MWRFSSSEFPCVYSLPVNLKVLQSYRQRVPNFNCIEMITKLYAEGSKLQLYGDDYKVICRGFQISIVWIWLHSYMQRVPNFNCMEMNTKLYAVKFQTSIELRLFYFEAKGNSTYLSIVQCIKSNQVWILITFYRFIGHQKESCLVPNH